MSSMIFQLPGLGGYIQTMTLAISIPQPCARDMDSILADRMILLGHDWLQAELPTCLTVQCSRSISKKIGRRYNPAKRAICTKCRPLILLKTPKILQMCQLLQRGCHLSYPIQNPIGRHLIRKVCHRHQLGRIRLLRRLRRLRARHHRSLIFHRQLQSPST